MGRSLKGFGSIGRRSSRHGFHAPGDEPAAEREGLFTWPEWAAALSAQIDRARAESAEALDEIDVPRLELPAINDGIDLGSLYELAEALAQQGVR